MIWTLALLILLAPPDDDRPTAHLADPELVEVSGLVRSRRHREIFWTHNDSGQPAALFAVRADGTVVARFPVAVPNIDWEDIATDDAGRIYLGDIGNNFGLLPIRAIHRFEEPDPFEPAGNPLRPERSWYYRFERGAGFDAESLVIESDRILLLTKNLDRTEAEFRSIPIEAKAPPLAPILTTPAGRLPGFVEPATGADLSPDGRRLAVCSLRLARIYHRDDDGSWRLQGQIRYRMGQVEAIAWDGPDLLIAAEDGRFLRFKAREPDEPSPVPQPRPDR